MIMMMGKTGVEAWAPFRMVHPKTFEPFRDASQVCACVCVSCVSVCMCVCVSVCLPVSLSVTTSVCICVLL